MRWPTSQDYNEAVQHPASAFADPDLAGGTAAVNALGLPAACSGNFADVYRVDGPAGRATRDPLDGPQQDRAQRTGPPADRPEQVVGPAEVGPDPGGPG